MLIRAIRHGLVAVTLAVVTLHAAPAAAQGTDPNPGNLSVTGTMDFLNAYMFRGIRQDDTKVIMWPALDLGMSVY